MKTLHRTLAAALLVAMTLAATPATAAASTAPGVVAAGPSLPSWLSWLAADWLTHQEAGQEALPNMDPNGAQATPEPPGLPEVDAATPNGADDGETLPDMDPNG